MPEPGALFDQPAGLLRKMTAANNIYSIVGEWDAVMSSGHGVNNVQRWTLQYPNKWQLVGAWLKLRNHQDG